MEDKKFEQNATKNQEPEGSSKLKINKPLKDDDNVEISDPNIDLKRRNRCENDGQNLVTIEVSPGDFKESIKEKERPAETCDTNQGTEKGKTGQIKKISHALRRWNKGSSNPVGSLESNQDSQIICLGGKDDLSKDVLTADKSTLYVVGQGTFGRVLKSTNPAHANYVIKEVFCQGKKINPNEVIVPLKLNSPRMLSVYAIQFDLSERMCRIVMQDCGKDLKKLLFDDSKFMDYLKDNFNFCKFMAQLFSTVGELEDLKVVHGDLKLANVTAKWVNNSFEPFLIDFGSCVDINDTPFPTCITPEFSPPELNLMLLLGIKREVDPKKIDCWAVGVIGFCLYNKGTHPVSVATYHGKKATILEKISKLEQSDVDKWTPLDDGSFLHKALRGSVRIDPNKRISAKEAAKLLEDNLVRQSELERPTSSFRETNRNLSARASVKDDDPWAVKNKSMQDEKEATELDEIFSGDGNERKRKPAPDEEDATELGAICSEIGNKRQKKSAKFPPLPFLKDKE